MALYSSNLTTDGAIKLILEITEVSQNQAANTSQVRFRALIQGSAGGTTYNYDPTPGYLIANGARFDFSLPSYSWAGSINTVLIDKTITVYHDNGGNATASGTVYWDPQNPSSVLGLIPATPNGSMTLTRIGRADVVWNGTYTVGDQGFVIKVPTKYGLATRYVVRISVGGVQFDYELPNVNQSEYLVIPTQEQLDAFYRSAGPKVSQVSYYATLYTYQGSTLIGYTTDQATMIFVTDANAPGLDNLVIGNNVKETNSAVLNVVGHNFISTLSNIKIDITGAYAQYGANIGGYEILVKNASGTIVASGTAATLNFLPQSHGQHSIYARVKDTRGIWSPYKTLSINVLAYSLPSISKFIANRSDASGVLNILGTSLKVEMAGSVASIIVGRLQKNRLTYRVDDITNSTVNKVPNTAVVALNFSDTKIISTFAIDQVYKIQLTVTDVFGKSSTAVFIVPISQVPMTWGKKGIAAGGIYSESDTNGIAFQCLDTAHFFKDVKFDKAPIGMQMVDSEGGDYSNGYVRYTDGRQITWKTIVLSNQSFANPIGTNYYSDPISLGAQPIAFISDMINVTSHVESTGLLTAVNFVDISKSSLGNIYCTRNGTNSVVSSITIKIRCEGRWK